MTLNAGARVRLARAAPRIGFLSQLIAERHHMAPQRARRQATLAHVLEVYDAGGRIAERRLPPGYRMNLET
ncbi:MAG: hypothetical protein ABIO40_00925 [Devosia sp.]